MKRIVILVAIALCIAGFVSAEEKILIDFSKLKADIHVQTDPNETDEQKQTPNQNRQTVMDYGQVAGGSFTDAQKAVMKTSLAIVNWDVVFSSSSKTVTNVANTYTREAPSKQFGTVMGVRVHFPVEAGHYSKATIKPPFEIPAYEAQGTVDDQGNITTEEGQNGVTGPSRLEEGYGIVKNVGTLKSVAVNAYGLNFPHGLNVLLLDADGNERVCFMGYLNYDGWAELTWNNPQYISDVRNRELRLYPLYPQSTPFIKFAGLRVDRDADAVGGDFIGYFKDVKVIYDKAVLDTDRDIDDEALWNIIYDRETAKRVWEMQNFGEDQIERYLDKQKQATESTFTPTPTSDSGSASGTGTTTSGTGTATPAANNTATPAPAAQPAATN